MCCAAEVASRSVPPAADMHQLARDGLLAASLLALLAWTILRVARPKKLLLRAVPGRPNRLGLLHLLIVFLTYGLGLALAGQALAAAAGFEGKPEDAPLEVALPAGMLGQMLWAGLSIAVGALTFRHGLRRGMGLSVRRWQWDALRGIAGWLILYGPVCLSLAAMIAILKALAPQYIREPRLLQVVSQEAWGWRVAAVVSAALLAPLAEELFYRGLVQSWVRKRLGGRPWPAVLITSAAFAACHYNQLQAVPGLFLLSVGLGYVYERTGRLAAPILMHGLFNAVMMYLRTTG